MASGKEEKKKEEVEVITAIYKVNLHCNECGRKIKKHLMMSQGVQGVEIDIERGEIKAKGKIDPLKMLKLIEKKSQKKVELISPKVKPKEITIADKKPNEIKDPIIRIISVKVHMHCDKCEVDLESRLIKHKGIFNVKTDQKAQNVTVEGTIEVEKLISFLRKRVHKNAEIVSIKEVKKEEKKGTEEGKTSVTTKEKDHGESTKKKDGDDSGKVSGESAKKKDGDGSGKSSGESAKIKDGDETAKSSGESAKKKDGDETAKKSGESTKEKGGETTKIIETREGHPKEEAKIKDNVPYIIHYVYAPQLFSDENPNSCSIL
ncbi:unnamed protein product [Sphenostylis stenocarpa]|uniref:HMA domain-containing protein n=1 Tax=Sphenostylis stenocarpa TaxID=92480 RepID=A0AA86VY68_9FABA|nr:unnamed protein product [Sphenostylis stenocarpa]